MFEADEDEQSDDGASEDAVPTLRDQDAAEVARNEGH
jgi:hypothetical protein